MRRPVRTSRSWTARENSDMKQQMQAYNDGNRVSPSHRSNGKRMPFGKYKNYPIANVPRDYLLWFVENVQGCDDIKAIASMVLFPNAAKVKRKAKKKRKRLPEDVKAHARDAAKMDAEFKEIFR